MYSLRLIERITWQLQEILIFVNSLEAAAIHSAAEDLSGMIGNDQSLEDKAFRVVIAMGYLREFQWYIVVRDD